MGTKKKIDRRILKTKRAISVSLFELLSGTELDDITITALTTLADINRKTFYLHYTGVEEVAREVEENIKTVFGELADASVTDGVFQPQVFFEKLVAKLSENKELFRALCAEKTMTFFIHKVGTSILKKLMEVYRPMTDLDDIRLRYALIQMAYGVCRLYSDWAMFPSITLEDVSDIACKLVVAETAVISK